MRVTFKNIRKSLVDFFGKDYLDAVCAAQAYASGRDRRELFRIADEQIDFCPESFQNRADELIRLVGQQACPALASSAAGAATEAFRRASSTDRAPLSGYGPVRIGEDGRVYMIAKSEHYHASLGHGFPGYRLIENAKRLGILNITHNNSRGHMTRVLEQQLVAAANGIAGDDTVSLDKVIADRQQRVLNRVINLETGSLAVEAALKMMLSRFYKLEASHPDPAYAGRIPVFLVMADNQGGKAANYHGTTVLTQAMRGLWPGMYRLLEEQKIFQVKSVAINDPAHFEKRIDEYERPPYKIAGFFHEIVLMNYGGIRLTETYLKRVYSLCHRHDIPVCADEIQSCIWSPQYFLFREYGLDPDFVSVGKGFPGGQYPASKVLTTPAMDNLDQFGALVTNGQEELASLAYLITMEFVRSNGAAIQHVGTYYQRSLQQMAEQHGGWIDRIEGHRHLSSIFFREAEAAVRFVKGMNEACIDVSAQTYKADCPPAVLTKLPLIMGTAGVDRFIETANRVLRVL